MGGGVRRERDCGRSSGSNSGSVSYVVSWWLEPSQPLGIIYTTAENKLQPNPSRSYSAHRLFPSNCSRTTLALAVKITTTAEQTLPLAVIIKTTTTEQHSHEQ